MADVCIGLPTDETGTLVLAVESAADANAGSADHDASVAELALAVAALLVATATLTTAPPPALTPCDDTVTALAGTPIAAASCASNALAPSALNAPGLIPSTRDVDTVVTDTIPGSPGGSGGCTAGGGA